MGVMPCYTRRDFIKLIPPAIILGIPQPAYSQELPKLEEIAKREAQDFISSIPTDLSEIERVALSYDVYMCCNYGIVLKSNTELSMKKNGNEYQATVKITEPEPQTEWSWILMNLIGKNTSEYKDLLRSIKLKISETFYMDKTFKTKTFEQEMLQKDLGIKTIKVEFDYEGRQARLLKDEGNDILTIPLDCQTGPMTGYFNLLFFPDKANHMTIIKPQKRENFEGIEYVFRSENVLFKKDGKIYRFLFDKGSLFEVVEGGVVYNIVENNRSHLPYIIRIESVVNPRRRNARDKRIKELEKMDPRPPDYEEIRKSILAQNIHTAKDVKAFLIDANIS